MIESEKQKFIDYIGPILVKDLIDLDINSQEYKNVEEVCYLLINNGFSNVLREYIKKHFHKYKDLLEEIIKQESIPKLFISILSPILNDQENYKLDNILIYINNVERLVVKPDESDIVTLVYHIFAVKNIDGLEPDYHRKLFVFINNHFNGFIDYCKRYWGEKYLLDDVDKRLLQYQDKPLKQWIYFLSALSSSDYEGIIEIEARLFSLVKNYEKESEIHQFLSEVYTFFNETRKKLIMRK